MTEERLSVGAPDKAAAFSNYLFVGPSDKLGNSTFVEANGYVFNVARREGVADGTIALNSVQRKILRIDDGERLAVQRYKPPPDLPSIGMVYAEVRRVKDSKQALELQAEAVIKKVLDSFLDQIFTVHQEVTFELQGANLKIVITQLVVDQAGQAKEVARGFLRGNTAFILVNGGSNAIKIAGQKGFAATQLFKTKKINFTDLGIGGLDRQFEAIFRRAFASRTFAPSILQRMGLKHVKGMLLYGPPGTGKTLIARQIGKMLNGKEPKVVNGPEILNKFVGASEENIRNLFADADAEYKEKGDESDLHIIIFDEIDAICKQRGSVQGGSGVHDTVVNQLLTKMDGVDALNNILIIGMTNRKDMLDEALLRPGRLEVHVEVGLPDEAGRLQILQIHTNKMSENSFLARDVNLTVLAERTKNFSGAELEGLVKDASAFALNRNVDFNDLSKAIDETNIKVTMQDFEHSLEEVKAAFGASTETLSAYAVHGIIESGEASKHLLQTLRTLVAQVKTSEKTPLLSCVLEGPTGSGKSALAASVARESDFPFIKVITSETMVGFSEAAKCQQIARVFDDAYKSPLSIIILDDIERLLEYVAIGPRFSNVILQALLVLVKRPPPAGRRLLIIGTTSSGDVIESMGMSDVFNVSLHVPSLRTDELVRVLRVLDIFEVKDIPSAVEELAMVTGKNLSVPIKKLLLWVELAKQGVQPGQRVSLDQWATVLRDLS